MLIQGRGRRVKFLQELRSRLHTDAPVLVSFWARPERSRTLTIVYSIARCVRGLLGRETVEYGDNLGPTFSHSFTEEEIADELESAGYSFVEFCEAGYGRAVGFANGTPSTEAPQDASRD